MRGDEDGELRNTQMLTSDPLISGCLGHMTARREGSGSGFVPVVLQDVRIISSHEVKLFISPVVPGSHQQEQL